MRCTMAQSTLPRRWWARMADRAVNTMQASEVAMAVCATTGDSMPCRANTNNRPGTSTMPPPTPSKPANKPAAMPSAR